MTGCINCLYSYYKDNSLHCSMYGVEVAETDNCSNIEKRFYITKHSVYVFNGDDYKIIERDGRK